MFYSGRLLVVLSSLQSDSLVLGIGSRHRTTKHDTHSLEGPMQSSWQKAPQPLHTIMAFSRQ
ncbi:hypothetical protein EYF80_004765 [Liparis tanakae]|uniref:Uncharacterized protein n=1 Tax=Liparis tanakae TaxID=230148 RepID=A0A4Z2J599_9TELE|nr:hypothetical protein EYF80_004765 [Liparis tanakae]